MEIAKVMIAAFSATNIMTSFSYIMSNHYGKLFKEPVLLNYILHGIGITLHGRWGKLWGWFAHYIIGLFFVICYELIWTFTSLQFGFGSGILLGLISGPIGILGWSLIYLLPDKKPAAALTDYYLQLFIAHVLFAVAVVVAFKLYDYDPLSKM